MPDLNIRVRDGLAELSGQPTIVCGNSGDHVIFDLDEAWEAYQVRCARFVYKDLHTQKMCEEEVLFEGDTAEMPAVFRTDLLLIGVYAGADLTSSPVAVPCSGGATDNDPEGGSPLPDVYAQLLAYLNAYEKRNSNGFVAGDAAAETTGAMHYTAGRAEKGEIG